MNVHTNDSGWTNNKQYKYDKFYKLALMLLVTNMTNTIVCKKRELKMTETLAHGYSSESILNESYPMNMNMTGFKRF